MYLQNSAAIDRASDEAHATAPTLATESQRLAVWFFILSLAVVFALLAGGIVRITGSGLSIPEWPIVNGSLLPPLTESSWTAVYQTYYAKVHGLQVSGPSDGRFSSLISMGRFQMLFAIEYVHRLAVAVVSILFLSLFMQIMRAPSLRAKFGTRVVAIGIILLSQALLGGLSTYFRLPVEVLALHLILAFALFGVVFWTGLQFCFGSQRLIGQPWLTGLSWTAFILVSLQTMSGGLVAATQAGFVFNTWPHMGGVLVLSMDEFLRADVGGWWLNFVRNPALVQFFHRWFAFVTTVAVLLSCFVAARRAISLRARLAYRGVASLVVLQVLLGISTLVMKTPAILATLHLMVGLLLFALLLWSCFEIGLGENENAF